VSPTLVFATVALILWFNQTPDTTPTEEPPAAPSDRVVLLPGPEGKPGKILVSTKAGEQWLDSAYAGADIGAAGQIAAFVDTEASVRARFGAALDAQPARPLVFKVYFVSGRNELTAESLPTIAAIKQALAQRPAPEISVVGHTDRVGTVEANDKLSLRRAETVKQVLVQEGLPVGLIEASGRGERQALAPTADEVAEPLNRRVEIEIR
jgi:outer membrane protein OmpA-like peptidoglycan-associated protein